MNQDCLTFRRLLESALAGGLTELGWHEHLTGCADCRELLQREEALELLLASLPQPTLPPDLARRLLARLRDGAPDGLDELLELADPEAVAPCGLAERVVLDARLDRLLDQAGEVQVPAGLAERVLAGARLEQLLDQDPGVAAPVGLPERVLAGVREQTQATTAPQLRLVRGAQPATRTWRSYAAAAVVLLGLGATLWRFTAQGAGPSSTESLAEVQPAHTGESLAPLDEELLAQLDMLEQLELAEELDPVGLDTLVFLDVSDEIMLGWDELTLDVEGEAR